MIRVTFKNEKPIEMSEFLLKSTKSYQALLDNDKNYPLQIEKIEKQVKDLTLEECNNLGLELNTRFLKFLNNKAFVVISVTSENYGCLQLDDYLNITSLIKGE